MKMRKTLAYIRMLIIYAVTHECQIYIRLILPCHVKYRQPLTHVKYRQPLTHVKYRQPSTHVKYRQPLTHVRYIQSCMVFKDTCQIYAVILVSMRNICNNTRMSKIRSQTRMPYELPLRIFHYFCRRKEGSRTR
jgi:hypothetical protein